MLLQAYRELEQLGEGHELNYLPSYQKAWQMFVDQVLDGTVDVDNLVFLIVTNGSCRISVNAEPTRYKHRSHKMDYGTYSNIRR